MPQSHTIRWPNQDEFRPYNICLDLLCGFENQGFFVYADNYYTPLLKELSTRRIFYTGRTRKISKGLPKIDQIKPMSQPLILSITKKTPQFYNYVRIKYL